MSSPWTDRRPPRTEINKCFSRPVRASLAFCSGPGRLGRSEGGAGALSMHSVTMREEMKTGKGPFL